MSRRVRLRLTGEKRPEYSSVAALIYCNLEAAITNIIETKEGYVVVCRSHEDAEKLLTNKAVEALQKSGMKPIPPPELRAKRSVVCKGVPKWIGALSTDDLQKEIEKAQTWAKVTEVVKFGHYTHIFKVTFAETQMAEKASKEGILLSHMVIPPSNIKREEYVNTMLCLHCYTHGDHYKNNCPKKAEPKRCSECSSDTHDYTKCTSTEKKCLNCGGPHSAMAISCPFRKRATAEKKQEVKDQAESRKQTSYANIAKQAARETVKETAKPTVTELHVSTEMQLKMCAIIYEAHLCNVAEPGSFSRHLDELLRLNNLPLVNLGTNPPSDKITNLTMVNRPAPDAGEYKKKELGKKTPAKPSEAEQPATPPEVQEEDKQPEKEAPKEKRAERRPARKVCTLYTTKDNPFPKDHSEILRGLGINKYKWDPPMTYTEIVTKVVNTDIAGLELKVLPREEFSKLGVTESPPSKTKTGTTNRRR